MHKHARQKDFLVGGCGGGRGSTRVGWVGGSVGVGVWLGAHAARRALPASERACAVCCHASQLCAFAGRVFAPASVAFFFISRGSHRVAQLGYPPGSPSRASAVAYLPLGPRSALAERPTKCENKPNPWHIGAQSGMHLTVGGRQGLTSTTHSCILLRQCNESVFGECFRAHVRTRACGVRACWAVRHPPPPVSIFTAGSKLHWTHSSLVCRSTPSLRPA